MHLLLSNIDVHYKTWNISDVNTIVNLRQMRTKKVTVVRYQCFYFSLNTYVVQGRSMKNLNKNKCSRNIKFVESNHVLYRCVTIRRSRKNYSEIVVNGNEVIDHYFMYFIVNRRDVFIRCTMVIIISEILWVIHNSIVKHDMIYRLQQGIVKGKVNGQLIDNCLVETKMATLWLSV